jgi:hypothetical protein
VRRRIKATTSPSMVVACIAVVLALTGSAFAAQALITGADVKDGSLTRADLSKRTLRSLKGKRGPAGAAGRDGFVGPQGPQGSTGPEGPRGPVGPAGPQGPKGTTGDTGARGGVGATGATGPAGATGDTGPAGPPGQLLVYSAPFAGVDVGTALASTSGGPDSTEGAELGGSGTYLTAGVQYKVDVFVSFVDTNATDPGVEYGVARLFLGSSPLDGVNPTGGGGNSDIDTTLVTPDVPDDQNNAAQASGSFLVTAGDDGFGGEQLTLRGALRTDDPGGASVTGHVIVTQLATP